jgi:hypothetical protein
MLYLPVTFKNNPEVAEKLEIDNVNVQNKAYKQWKHVTLLRTLQNRKIFHQIHNKA